MNTYKLEYSGKTETVKGINLLSAVKSLGFTNVQITPKWYRRSNGKYSVTCDGNVMISAEWVEKRNQLN